MSLAAVAPPLIAYAIVFQTLVYLSLPHRRRGTWAPVTTGVVGAGLTLAAALAFGSERVGLLPRGLLEALFWGLTAALACAVGGVFLLAMPRGRAVLADPRVSRLSTRQAMVHVFVRIPLLTALVEEALFRGLLHAVLVTIYPLEVAMLLGAGLFGIWHVAPGLDQAKAAGRGGRSDLIHTISTVFLTALCGLFLVWLRVETGSIWAPVAVHAAINMTLTLLARVAVERVQPKTVDSLPACTHAASSFVSPAPSQGVPSGSA